MKRLCFCLLMAISTMSMTSCATIFGGRVEECQRTKPPAGQPSRKVRVVPLIADILIFAPALIVDFATGAMYKPCGK